MQWTDDTMDVPDNKWSGLTTIRFKWFVIRQTPSLSNSPTMLTTSPALTEVSYLANKFKMFKTDVYNSDPTKQIQQK